MLVPGERTKRPSRLAAVRVVALFFAVVSSSGRAGSAQPAPYESDAPRVLAGHRFLPFRTVAYPFVVSRVGTDLTVGVADLELVVEDVPRPGDRFTEDGMLAFLDESLAAQAALGELVAVRVGFAAGVTGGADEFGAIDVGANVGLGLHAGLTFRLHRGDRVYVALAVDGQIVRGLGIAPKRLLLAARIEGDQLVIGDFDLTYDARVLRLDPALATAFTLAPAVGLQVSGGYTLRHVDAARRFPDQTEHSLNAGVGLSFFFGPAAILVGGRVVGDLGSDFDESVVSAIEPLDPTRGEAELGLFFTGRPELDLGIVGIGTLSDRDRRLQGTARLAYYFGAPATP
jgi:hypothetical protein